MKMKFTRIFTYMVIASGMLLTSCENVIGPDKDNHSTPDRLYTDPAFAEGLLLNGYTNWRNSYVWDEAATDDAVTNVKGNAFQRMATGEWSALYNPMSVWDNSYRTIYYLNFFLKIAKDVNYAWDDRSSSSAVRDSLFVKRFTAEAKVLRAWHNFELLKNHGGVASNGQPQGFIIFRTMPDRENYNLARNSYDECVQFILEDLNKGIADLPNVYADIAGDVAYNVVFGNTSSKNKNRINGKFAKALKSRVLLHAASQSFYNAPAKWDSAAVAAAKLITTAGGGVNGISALVSANGLNFWKFENDAEIIFRLDYFNSNTREVDNFPPGIVFFGNGKINPSQNLVDAFPMANSYPISHSLSGYSAANPYTGRDPRLKAYIIYNGNDLNGKVVGTNVEDANSGLNVSLTATRTGYYLKKLLQPAINLNPTVMSTARNFYTVFRNTEMFLNYAEAANEAWGPVNDPKGYGFTPKTIMAAIRKRAGIASADPYLASITSQAEMRDLIRNERRLELCFEGFRFWDMRRWNLKLDDKVKGVSIANNVPTIIDVEDRSFKDFMQFGPVPYQETLKSNLTLQNNGW